MFEIVNVNVQSGCFFSSEYFVSCIVGTMRKEKLRSDLRVCLCVNARIGFVHARTLVTQCRPVALKLEVSVTLFCLRPNTVLVC